MIWRAAATGLASSTKRPATPKKAATMQRPATTTFFCSSIPRAPRRVMRAKVMNMAAPLQRDRAARHGRGGILGAAPLAVRLGVGVHQIPLAELHGQPVVGRHFIVLAEPDGVLGAGFLTHAAVDATEHVDAELGRPLLFEALGDVEIAEFLRLDTDAPGRAGLLAHEAGHALDGAVLEPFQLVEPAIAGGHLLFHIRILDREALGGGREELLEEVLERDAHALHHRPHIGAVQPAQLDLLDQDTHCELLSVPGSCARRGRLGWPWRAAASPSIRDA